MFKIHSPETVPENCSMFMLAKFPGAKLVHLQKANWSIRTSAESKPKQSEITVNLCLFELLEKSYSWIRAKHVQIIDFRFTGWNQKHIEKSFV